eukprot:scaffold78485_cov22-Tisochrysis_lutea.AAC.3
MYSQRHHRHAAPRHQNHRRSAAGRPTHSSKTALLLGPTVAAGVQPPGGASHSPAGPQAQAYERHGQSCRMVHKGVYACQWVQVPEPRHASAIGRGLA